MVYPYNCAGYAQETITFPKMWRSKLEMDQQSQEVSEKNYDLAHDEIVLSLQKYGFTVSQVTVLFHNILTELFQDNPITKVYLENVNQEETT